VCPLALFVSGLPWHGDSPSTCRTLRQPLNLSNTPRPKKTTEFVRTDHLPSEQPSQFSSTMVNKNTRFEAVPAEDRKRKKGHVCILDGQRYVTAYPGDSFICPWCGVSAISIGAMTKHWVRCAVFKEEHPETAPLEVPQDVVQPVLSPPPSPEVSGSFRYLYFSTFGSHFLFRLITCRPATRTIILLVPLKHGWHF
jgi:hypothetical protein